MKYIKIEHCNECPFLNVGVDNRAVCGKEPSAKARRVDEQKIFFFNCPLPNLPKLSVRRHIPDIVWDDDEMEFIEDMV